MDQSRFWQTSDVAGPTMWDVLRIWDRSPRFLRTYPRRCPAPLAEFTKPVQLGLADGKDLASFWSTEYKGDDWRMVATVDWVAPLLQIPNTLFLAAKREGRIVGTIACVGIGKVRMGETTFQELYVIEGLCIASAWRGKHLAGWLIAWVDHLMNQTGPKAFLWSRESPRCMDISYISSHTYGYIDTTRVNEIEANGLPTLMSVNWEEFAATWRVMSLGWDSEMSLFPTSLSHPLHVWRHGDQYIALADTRRVHKGPIWEVVWCGTFANPFEGKGTRRMLEALVVQGVLPPNTVLFCSSAAYQGGITRDWPPPWIYGTAGVHTTYLYNFMPPTFHDLRVLLPRVDL
jgi:hypothetical protein